MGAQISGIDTPFGGVSSEYTNKEKQSIQAGIEAGWKLKIFISSICGQSRYDHVRQKLKKLIENTKLANVYLFEQEQASTISAGNHYLFALEDSDICIFLIDNADGVTPGVQAEINRVRKNNIQSLYYFCDEKSTDKTTLEQSLMGAQFAKSKTVHKFEDLSSNGAQGLLDDIVLVYHHYCKGRLQMQTGTEEEKMQKIKLSVLEENLVPVVPKAVLENVAQCRRYLLKLTDAWFWGDSAQEQTGHSDMDEWCANFLPILFEGKSIREFNTGMFLEILQSYQTAEHFKVVQERWQAIQAYFLGNLEKCVDHLKTSLQIAKDTKRPTWVINDILIDLRNIQWEMSISQNRWMEPQAQEELRNTTEAVYYPILDRFQKSIYEKYMDGLYKQKIESPHTVTFGGDLSQYCEMLASSYIVSMYHGSLTHILRLHDEVKRFLFYLCSRYDDWKFRRNLFKFAIHTGRKDEIRKVRDSYPDVLNKLTAVDAADIMHFCSSNPISFINLECRLRAFGFVGYYLEDSCFQKYQNQIINEIKQWFNEENPIVDVGGDIFPSLSDVCLRMSQNQLAEICVLFMEHHYRRWYTDMFRFMGGGIDLSTMSNEWAESLINHICVLLDDEKVLEMIHTAPSFLYVFRKQAPVQTEVLDHKIREKLSGFAVQEYRMETAENIFQEFPDLISDYISKIRNQNETQGKNGIYCGYAERIILKVRSFILNKDFKYKDLKQFDQLVSIVADTILLSKESVLIKLDAVAFLFSVVLRYSDVYERNKICYDKIFNQQNDIGFFDDFGSNIDRIAFQIGLQLLFIAMGQDRSTEMIELLPCIEASQATILSVEETLHRYLTSTDGVRLPEKVETVVLQYVLQWLRSENTYIRYNAAKLLLILSNVPENEKLVNRQLIYLVDTDNVYTKNLIMRNIWNYTGIHQVTRENIISKCENDPNYVVRMVCLEEKKKHAV